MSKNSSMRNCVGSALSDVSNRTCNSGHTSNTVYGDKQRFTTDIYNTQALGTSDHAATERSTAKPKKNDPWWCEPERTGKQSACVNTPSQFSFSVASDQLFTCRLACDVMRPEGFAVVVSPPAVTSRRTTTTGARRSTTHSRNIAYIGNR